LLKVSNNELNVNTSDILVPVINKTLKPNLMRRKFQFLFQIYWNIIYDYTQNTNKALKQNKTKELGLGEIGNLNILYYTVCIYYVLLSQIASQKRHRSFS